MLGGALSAGAKNLRSLPPAAPAALTRPKIPARTATNATATAPKPQMGSTTLPATTQVGRTFGHRDYGQGTIQSIQDGIATMQFPNNVTRQYRVAPAAPAKTPAAPAKTPAAKTPTAAPTPTTSPAAAPATAPAGVRVGSNTFSPAEIQEWRAARQLHKPAPISKPTAAPASAAPSAAPTRTPSIPDRAFSAARAYGNMTGVAPTSRTGLAMFGINPMLQQGAGMLDNSMGTNFSGQNSNQTDWTSRVGQAAFPTSRAQSYLKQNLPTWLQQAQQFLPK